MDVKDRCCLKCRKSFTPKHKGNFICSGCNSKNSRLVGKMARSSIGAGQPRGGIKSDR